jgi:hypothetical protein
MTIGAKSYVISMTKESLLKRHDDIPLINDALKSIDQIQHEPVEQIVPNFETI